MQRVFSFKKLLKIYGVNYLRNTSQLVALMYPRSQGFCLFHIRKDGKISKKAKLPGNKGGPCVTDKTNKQDPKVYLCISFDCNLTLIYVHNIEKHLMTLTSVHSVDPINPNSSASQLQSIMVRLGLQPETKYFY